MEAVGTVKVGQRPRGITVTHDGKFILICASDDDTVEVLDASTYERVGIAVGSGPELFVLHPDGSKLYIANEDDNLVTIVDMRSRSMVVKSRWASNPKAWASARTERCW